MMRHSKFEVLGTKILCYYRSNETSLIELLHGALDFLGFFRRLEYFENSSTWLVLGVKGFKKKGGHCLEFLRPFRD